jgi:hypothetical protein
MYKNNALSVRGKAGHLQAHIETARRRRGLLKPPKAAFKIAKAVVLVARLRGGG